MTFTITKTTRFETTSCCSCAGDIALPEFHLKALRKNGQSMWCPYCGTRQSWKETEADRLRTKVEHLENEMKWADNKRRQAENDAEYQRRSKIAYKGQLTKIRRKVANGVCPCCNRTFVNLQRHMTTKHPDFVIESNAGIVNAEVVK